jgi:hypothetical protein
MAFRGVAARDNTNNNDPYDQGLGGMSAFSRHRDDSDGSSIRNHRGESHSFDPHYIVEHPPAANSEDSCANKTSSSPFSLMGWVFGGPPEEAKSKYASSSKKGKGGASSNNSGADDHDGRKYTNKTNKQANIQTSAVATVLMSGNTIHCISRSFARSLVLSSNTYHCCRCLCILLTLFHSSTLLNFQ